jgi:hypothetical protein
MALSRKMYHAVDPILVENPYHVVKITDISLDKHIVRLIFDILKVLKVSGIGKGIKIYDPVLRILVDEKPYHMASNETGTTGNQYVSFEI